MTDAMLDLARRAVACKGWRWMPGMRAIGKYPNYPVRIHAFGENVQDPDDMLAADKWLPWQQPVEYGDHIYDGPYLPDLTDAATLGCILALYEETRTTLSCPVYTYASAYGLFHPKTLEALVHALEAP